VGDGHGRIIAWGGHTVATGHDGQVPELTSDVDAAVAVLRAGGLVGLPTETVYGLAAHARNPEAVRRVFTVKGRPPTHPLIVHLPDVSHVARWAATVPDTLGPLAAALWPGPLTVVVRAGPDVVAEVTGGRDTVALRVPAHPLALEVLGRLDDGVAAPSANRFGGVSPTTAAHVVADLGDDVDLVLDGGPCAVGVESTIVDLSGARPEVLRTGAVSASQLSSLLGAEVVTWSGDGDARAPGMLASHYAPHAAVLVIDEVGAAAVVTRRIPEVGLVAVLASTTGQLDAVRAALVGFDDRLVDLEPVGDADGFAHELYDRLRQVDRLGCAAVIVVAPPPEGIGVAVRDRLTRAAAGE
jgi:L-threonylcarbamoyladenylate synthase